MKINKFFLIFLVMALVLAAPCRGETPAAGEPPATNKPAIVIKLPKPREDGKTSVESALRHRRATREFRNTPLTLAEVSQLLWAAQGITSPDGKRTAPSAGALYPLEVFVVAGSVESLPAGVYRYRPQGHDLSRVTDGDKRVKLASLAQEQTWLKGAPAIIVIAGVYERTAVKYKERAERYVHIEAGHASQNVQLQAVALELGAVIVGAFDDDQVKRVLGLAADEQPLCLLPVGRPRTLRSWF
jgi:SagB-type dehydrogenase family enzyme